MRLCFVALVLAVGASAGRAAVKTETVEYKHGDTTCEGFLAYDDTKATSAQKAPGVLVIPEWWGLNDYPKGRAEQLAKLGYVAFAADMYGVGKVTKDKNEAGKLAGQFYGKPLKVTVLYPGYIASEMNEKVDPSKAKGMVPTDKGVRAMVDVIEREKDAACVPQLPWGPMSVLMKHAPLGVLKRVM